jgi:SMC interacting uncharacterized protein involved in chromosome segregation
MKKREEYIDTMTKQLKEWSSKIDELEFKARAAKADMKVVYEQQVRDLKSKREDVTHKLRELGGASNEAWDTVKTGVEKAWDEFKNALSDARDKFKKAG